MLEQLGEMSEFFEDRMDADHDGERFVPNDAMRIATVLDELIHKISEYKDKEVADVSK